MVVAVSVDDADDSNALRERLGLSFPLYQDPTFELGRAWKVFDDETEIHLAATFVIARGGKVVFEYVGKDKTDRPKVQLLLDSLPK